MLPVAGQCSRSAVGSEKESLAADYLVRRGLRTVARNHRCRFGEIDLIMRDGDTLVFVEVRYRASSRYGTAAESVDARKCRRIVAAANHYLQIHPCVLPCRFDVIAIGEQDRIEWVKSAFNADV